MLRLKAYHFAKTTINGIEVADMSKKKQFVSESVRQSKSLGGTRCIFAFTHRAILYLLENLRQKPIAHRHADIKFTPSGENTLNYLTANNSTTPRHEVIELDLKV